MFVAVDRDAAVGGTEVSIDISLLGPTSHAKDVVKSKEIIKNINLLRCVIPWNLARSAGDGEGNIEITRRSTSSPIH